MSEQPKTREQLLDDARKCLEERKAIELSLVRARREYAATGRRSNWTWMTTQEEKAETLKLRERSLIDEARRIPKQRAAPSVGRMYVHLCRAVKAELGEAALASFVAAANRSIELEDMEGARESFEEVEP